MKYYIVDAFANQVFQGSPTAVCILDQWPDDNMMIQIAEENSLPETAFIIKDGEDYQIRWFAPNGEVDLCGHATLGTAYVVLSFLEPGREHIRFQYNSGVLEVQKNNDLFELALPIRVPQPTELTQQMIDALGVVPKETYASRDLFFVLESEEQVRLLKPNFEKMREIEYGDGVIVTAKGSTSDFVTRCFFPKLQTNEDPVCGSAHCNLIPYWASRLGIKKLVSHQLSARGAVLYCTLESECVKVAGRAALYSKGEIYIR